MRSFSGIRLFTAALALLASSASFAGFSISNGQLVDNNGTPFVMRGVAYPYTWYSWRGAATVQQDIANIAATRANTVRYVLSTGAQWARIPPAEVTNVIEWAKTNRMISVLEVHDSTGWSEGAGSVHINNAVQYWTSADIKAVLVGQENYVIINIANEPFGNNTTANYVADTIAAIQAMRAAGFTHTLMIDAANWGQDWTNTMRTNAMQIWNADPLRNTIFSVHMYEVYNQASAITSYMQAFDDMGLPLVIGEFGLQHNGQDVDEATIMAQAQSRANGYIAWSWSGNGGCCTFLDMVTNFSTTLTEWGNIVVNGNNGIAATSVFASVFGGSTNNLALSASSLSLAAGASSAAVSVTANVSWSVTDNQSWITVAPTAGTNNGSFTVSATANTGTAARTGTVTVTGGGLTRTVAVTQAAPATNTLTLSATSLSFASSASSSAVSVTANVGWTITDDQSWITVSPTSGSNNGSFTVSASANTGTAARTGTVTVTGGGLTRTVAVSQSAASTNTLNVSATSLSFASAAASQSVSITSNVSWTASDNQTWITVAPASGSNNATLTVSATANTAAAARTGTVTVTGGGITRTIAVSQSGVTANNLTVSASTLSLAAAASSGTVSITANVSWTVTDDQTWLSASPTSGTGNATLTLTAAANSGSTARTGTVTVTGGGITRTIAVTQSGAGGTGGTCSNPVTFSGNTGNFNTAGAVCYRTNANISGWGCYNFDGRTATVGGEARTCGQMPLTRSADGYYYFSVSAGTFPWAGLYTY